MTADAISIPIVALGASEGFGAEALQSAATAIAAAARVSGFFYLVDHGIDRAITDGQLALAAQFFDLPIDAKRAIDIAHSDIMRGYERMGLQTLAAGTRPDLKESLMLGRDLAPDHPLVAAGTPMEGANPWPAGLPGFREGVNTYIEAIAALGRRLAEALALSLDLPRDHFAAALAEPNCALRMLRYPPQEAVVEDQIGCGAHTDWGFLTILLQDDLGGLEIEAADGRWIAAPPIAGSFVINLGDMIPVLTNGRYRSSPHRVINNSSDRARHSIPLFFNPRYDYRFECAPTCLAVGETAPPPVSYGEHLSRKFSQTYA